MISKHEKIKQSQPLKVGRGQLLIALGSLIWGSQGLFAKLMMTGGATPIQSAAIKLLTGSFILFIFMALTCPKALKLDSKGLKLTLLIGLISQAGFNSLYYSSVARIGVASAAVILYTSPVFFLLFAWLFFKEKITALKCLSAGICITGCAVAIGLRQLLNSPLELVGVLEALLAAVAFALMGALGKSGLKQYKPLTIIVYSFGFGGLFLLPIAISQGVPTSSDLFQIALGGLGIGVFPAALSYLLYFTGVSLGVSLSQAGLISSLEMVSAVFMAHFLLGEPLSLVQLLGTALILFSIVLSEVGSYKKLSTGV